MINLKVELHHKPYPLYIGIDILPKLGEVLKLYGFNPHITLITDQKIKKKYFDTICDSLQDNNFSTNLIVLSKQQLLNGFHSLTDITKQLIKDNVNQNSPIVAFGGSNICNIGAFLSQILFGGVPYIQIPTSLTSQTIKAVNYKTTLPFENTESMFSIKYGHSLVWCDAGLIKSLPKQNFYSGIGHIIQISYQTKTGLYEYLENYISDIQNMNLNLVEEMILRTCDTNIKIYKKTKNLFSEQKRNFGDFIASVVYESAKFDIKWGEALLFGMMIESIVAFKAGIFENSYFERFYELLKKVSWNYIAKQINKDHVLINIEKKISSIKTYPLYSPKKIGEFILYKDYDIADFSHALNLILPGFSKSIT